MNKWQRIQAAMPGEPVDRVPISLWRHFHRQDRIPSDLAAARLALCHEYDLDRVKLTPSGLYAAEDWANPEIIYPGTEHEPLFLRTPALTDPRGWRELPFLDPWAGALGRELEAIRLVADGLAGQTPFLMTAFSPLTLTYKLAGKGLLDHVRQHPADLHAGLETIAQTTAQFAQAALDAGANGIFFAAQPASRPWLTPAAYRQFGEPYDLSVLAAVSRSALTVLHLHGQGIFFDLADRYPLRAVSWHDRETYPSMGEARQRTRRGIITGLDRTLLDNGPRTRHPGPGPRCAGANAKTGPGSGPVVCDPDNCPSQTPAGCSGSRPRRPGRASPNTRQRRARQLAVPPGTGRRSGWQSPASQTGAPSAPPASPTVRADPGW